VLDSSKTLDDRQPFSAQERAVPDELAERKAAVTLQ
jgi:hypothetical protein